MNTFDMYCTLCGGGPEGDRIAGALAGLHDVLKKRFKGYAGTSIGGIIATLAAFGISDDQIRRLFCAYLQDNFILDPHWSSLAKLQLLNWERISELSEKTLGKNAKMGDAQFDLVVTVTSLDLRRPFYVTKQMHADVLVSEVLTATSAMHTRITGSKKIQSLGTKLCPDRRLFVDGGWTDNTSDAVFDPLGRRCAVMLDQAGPERIRTIFEGGGPFEDDIAQFQSGLYAQSQPKSRRNDGVDIVIPRGVGWDFSKTPAEVNESWTFGKREASRQMKAKMVMP